MGKNKYFRNLHQDNLPQKISIKYTDDASRQDFIVEIPINYEGKLQSSAALVAAVKSYFSGCEKEEIAEKSIRYQVLSKHSEFLGSEVVNPDFDEDNHYGCLNYEEDDRKSESIERLLNMQLADGHWEFSRELEELVNYLLENKKIKDRRTPFVNLLIIAIFQEKCQRVEYIWDQSVKEAKKWLKKNRIQEKMLCELGY